ncbi:MAG: NAD(P)-dependent alcohol dehydrogenase [bacterium]|nr:NAD(P)-dependent alcohol dehydrogenase [bacterium]
MKAAVLEKVKKISIEEREIPKPKEDEVLVRIKSVGVCGSDIHYYNEGRIGSFVVEKPLVLGHECAGEVVEIGSKVKTLKVGDRIALEPGIPCRRCIYCKTGRYNLCPDVAFMATPPIDGAFTEYITHPEDFAFRLPDNVSFDEGALIEPLSVGIYSAERAIIRPEDTVLIFGAGPIGLVTLQAVKAYGAGQVFIVDINDFRLSKARELGADLVINSSLEKVEDYIKDGVDVVFEASGNSSVISQTTKFAKRGGKVVFIGLASEDYIGININEISSKELDLLGIFRYANVYKKAIDLLARGKVDLKTLITHRFPLEKTQEALEFADKNKDKCIKVIVNP